MIKSKTDATYELLNKLLDKYEKSRHAEEAGVSLRRVLINFSKGDMPSYSIEIAEIRDYFNASAIDLKKQNLVDFEWVRGRRDLVIDKIWLVVENAPKAYKAIGRISKKDIVQNLVSIYDSTCKAITTSWIQQFINDRINTLSNPGASLERYEKDEAILKNLIKVFYEYDKLDGEVTIRTFSIRCFGDSKYFENIIETYFLTISGRYEPALSEAVKYSDLSRGERLSMLGIMPMSELYEFAGCIRFELDPFCARDDEAGNFIDITPLASFGAAVVSNTINSINRIDMTKIRRVIFIENRTCYEEAVTLMGKKYYHSQVLLVYHGGFLSSLKKRFFSLICSDSVPGTEFLHWGDIDMGGFYMHSNLRSVIPSVKPLFMDPDSIEKYKTTGIKRKDQYLKRLKEMKEKARYSRFAGAIDKLLEYKITIEQEVFLDDPIDSLFL